MPQYKQNKFLPYTSRQLFDLVADIESYPEFLPWCLEVSMRENPDGTLDADLLIGLAYLQGSFTSRVILDPEHGRIHASYLRGPLRYMQNIWEFVPHRRGCMVYFSVDFAFRSDHTGALLRPFLRAAFRRMVGAFEERAKTLYPEVGKDTDKATSSADSKEKTRAQRQGELLRQNLRRRKQQVRSRFQKTAMLD